MSPHKNTGERFLLNVTYSSMQINLEKLITEANDKLAVSGPAAERSQQIEAFKKFLKVETERIRIRHRFGLGGLEIAGGRSYLVDLVVCRICQQAASEIGPETELESSAVIGLGGYGRRELAPFSDIDLLFLHAGRRSKVIRKFVEQVLYMLWDAGLTVGHSFRSISDCIAMAREDLHSRNAMSEARLVTGNQHLFRRFVRELDDSVYGNKRETDSFLQSMKLEIEARYDKFGRAVCMQEPNVKESAGGLRDLHAMLWVGHAAFGCNGLDALRAEDHISGAEYASARRGYDFIARIRNEAHFATGRKTDLLTLDLQAVLAPTLGYEDKRGLLASERFMRDYYARASELHRVSSSFLLRAFQVSSRRRFRLRPKPPGKGGSYVINQGKLQPRVQVSEFHVNPARLLEVFAVAQAENVDLSDELKLAIRGSLSVVDRRFRASAKAGKAFVEILRYRGRVAIALRAMHETGFLGRFVPEFARITFLVQHDFYHKYTIDEHTLKAVEALDRAATSNDPKLVRFGKVFAEIEDVTPLYLAILLHDIGKGHGGGHVAKGVRIAERITKRLGLEQEAAQKVIFLVKYHLMMSHLSQRRDLAEDSLIDEFTGKVGDLERLNMLVLLTYADTSGVGPGIWNEWKDALLWELYHRSRAHLTGRPKRWDSSRREAVRQKVMSAVAPDILPSEVERHFAMMPERYLRATDQDRLVTQLRMIKGLESRSLVTEWHLSEDKHFTDLTICTRDSAGLFARLAGTLSSRGLNILSADLNTREDGVVIDTFKISEVGGQQAVRSDRWESVEQALEDAVNGSFDVGAAVEKWRAKTTYKPRRRPSRPPAPPAVRFDSEASPVCTVIEVRAEDQPGLAYKISSTLAQRRLNITFAKIATEKNQALDVFYVTDPSGEKLLPDRMLDVETSLLEALGAGSGSKLMKEAV